MSVALSLMLWTLIDYPADFRSAQAMVTISPLDEDAGLMFINKLVPSGWQIDRDGAEIPKIDPAASDIISLLSTDVTKKVFTSRSYDPNVNYEDLEFLGDAAIRLSVSQLIEKKHGEMGQAWRNVSRTKSDDPMIQS
jgi:dsRNA-specific ribonuclease